MTSNLGAQVNRCVSCCTVGRCLYMQQLSSVSAGYRRIVAFPVSPVPPSFPRDIKKVLGVTVGVPALSEDAPVPADVRGLSGAQYKEKVISSLFRARWPGAVSVGMCQMLRDLDLGERQLSIAVSRVLRHLRKNAKLHDLPPLTYQLLLLAGRYRMFMLCTARVFPCTLVRNRPFQT